MFRSRRFRKFVLCLGLAMTAAIGAPIPPDEIADLLRMEQQAKIEFSLSKDGEDTNGEDPDIHQSSRVACVRGRDNRSHKGVSR